MADTIEIFCPECGEKIVCTLGEKNEHMSRYEYKGHCGECDKDIEIEDRACFEQEGLIYIELR